MAPVSWYMRGADQKSKTRYSQYLSGRCLETSNSFLVTVEGPADAARCRLDLDQTVAALLIEGVNVVAGSITIDPCRVDNGVG